MDEALEGAESGAVGWGGAVNARDLYGGARSDRHGDHAAAVPGGAAPEVIADDYELAVRGFEDHTRTAKNPREPLRTDEEPARWMAHTRAELTKRLEGLDTAGYLLRAGLTKGELGALRARLLA